MKALRWIVIAAAAGFPFSGHPQSYPAKPVRIVVPFPAGGGLDFTTRGSTPGEFAAFMRAEHAKYAKIINGAGIKVD